ncbi:MAG TPA: C40 family peptidase [Burkholderiales bacterium]
MNTALFLRRFLLAAALAALGACSSAPTALRSAARPAADDAASQALKMVGHPYKFGSAGPKAFDCSGLVQYSYSQAGIAVPRSTARQRLATHRIKLAELQRGDLIFFNQDGKKNSHVGIYLGDGKFVHAPSNHKAVRSDRLGDPYWKKHYSEARRIAA